VVLLFQLQFRIVFQENISARRIGLQMYTNITKLLYA